MFNPSINNKGIGNKGISNKRTDNKGNDKKSTNYKSTSNKSTILKIAMPLCVFVVFSACSDTTDSELLEYNGQNKADFATDFTTPNDSENIKDLNNSFGSSDSVDTDLIDNEEMLDGDEERINENLSSHHDEETIDINDLQTEAIQLLTLINEQKRLVYSPNDKRALFQTQSNPTHSLLKATTTVVQKHTSNKDVTVESQTEISDKQSENLSNTDMSAPFFDELSRPSNGRQLEDLERFELSQLIYRGMMAFDTNNQSGLIERPDGKVVVVKVGDYIGNRNGQIEQITSSGIHLIEIMVDSSGKQHKNAAILPSKF